MIDGRDPREILRKIAQRHLLTPPARRTRPQTLSINTNVASAICFVADTGLGQSWTRKQPFFFFIPRQNLPAQIRL